MERNLHILGTHIFTYIFMNVHFYLYRHFSKGMVTGGVLLETTLGSLGNLCKKNSSIKIKIHHIYVRGASPIANAKNERCPSEDDDDDDDDDKRPSFLRSTQVNDGTTSPRARVNYRDPPRMELQLNSPIRPHSPEAHKSLI